MEVHEVDWTYNNKKFILTDEILDKYFAFIYCITDDKGRTYYGKKAFTHTRRTRLSKKARVGTRKRIKVQQVDSKWLQYWGSCKPLLEYIAERGSTKGFKRKIIKLTEDKQSTTYWETYYLFINNVLFDESCWNGHILSRFYKNKIKH
jgi:hypothetical protein